MENKKCTLEELFDGYEPNPELRHKEFDFGVDVGRERIWSMTDEEYAKEYPEFNPEYLIPPSESLKEVMESRGMTEVDLAISANIDEQTIFDLLNNRVRINETIAESLKKAFNIPSSFWLNLEKNYQKSKAKLNNSLEE